MSILITGGLGYIGGRLATFLKEQTGEKIYLTTTRKEKALPAWAREFTVLAMNLRDKDSVERCIKDSGADTVVHLAAMNQNDCEKNPELAMDINVKGTSRLLEAAVANGVKRFVYFSTSHVYGKFSGEMTEESPTSPAHPYSQSKRAAEDKVSSYKGKSGMHTLILRLANAYGYPMDKDVNVWPLAFNSFCKQCMVDGKLVIRSNPYRDFISMQDVVRAVHHFLSLKDEKWGDGLFNVGGECCLSVEEVAQKVVGIYKKKFGQKPITIEYPSRGKDKQGKPFRYNVDKLKKTGFRWINNMEEEIVGTLTLCEEFTKEKVSHV